MCAIIDASAASEVFRSDATGAARHFYEWIAHGRGSLVLGGKLTKELTKLEDFKGWALKAVQSGRLRWADDDRVNQAAAKLVADGACRSNDQHVIALAQVTGARLLCASDVDLHRDFKDRKLIGIANGESVFDQGQAKLASAAQTATGRQHVQAKLITMPASPTQPPRPRARPVLPTPAPASRWRWRRRSWFRSGCARAGRREWGAGRG